MEKLDFRKLYADLYRPPMDSFVRVDVPEFQFVMIDGSGNPNTSPEYALAIQWLFSVSYALKFLAKSNGSDYAVPPLEGLWWADDPADFVLRNKERWKWTMMILAPDFIDQTMFLSAVNKSRKKLGDVPVSLRLAKYHEGLSLQIMHIGGYDEEGPKLSRLHDQIMPSEGLTFAGKHHEIYLSDARKTATDKLRTILRQPIRPN